MKEDKVALITEAGNGLGHTFARWLKSQGFEVVIAAKGEAYANLEKAYTEEVELIKADLTQSEEVEKLYQYISTTYGKLDVLVNNAEVANGFGQKITEIDMHEVRHLFDENLFSIMHTIKALHELLQKSEQATIINMSSSLGDITKMTDDNFCYADYQMLAYSMSKSALDMLSVLLEKEFKTSNISIYSYDPVKPQNCTHNSLYLCEEVKQEFTELIKV